MPRVVHISLADTCAHPESCDGSCSETKCAAARQAASSSNPHLSNPLAVTVGPLAQNPATHASEGDGKASQRHHVPTPRTSTTACPSPACVLLLAVRLLSEDGSPRAGHCCTLPTDCGATAVVHGDGRGGGGPRARGGRHVGGAQHRARLGGGHCRGGVCAGPDRPRRERDAGASGEEEEERRGGAEEEEQWREG
eukprot:1998122-Rhodomonas_salina.2